MSSKSSRWLAHPWRMSALAVALGSCLAGNALAQSNASGAIFGRVDAAQGTVVHIENPQTGVSRDVSVADDGRYRAPSLPVGVYKVTVMRDGQVVDTRDTVQVNIGTSTEVSFSAAAASSAKSLEGVNVVASAIPSIDVSSVDTRTVLNSDQLQRLPLPQSVNAAVLLAPGAVNADARYGNAVSLGGSSAAENQYYVNGFPVTNPLTGLGATQLPFNAIDQEQVFTGGYGAEYGRSTGGVVALVTKRGTNQWQGGAQVLYTPAGLRETEQATYRPGDGAQITGRDKHSAKLWETTYSAYIGGPLIKDKLFFFGSAEQIKSENNTYTLGTNVTRSYNTNETHRWLGKIDWNITDSHILEFTGMSDTASTYADQYVYDGVHDIQYNKKGWRSQKNQGTAGSSPGGQVYIAQYTGYVGDLTIDALYGKEHTDHVDITSGSDCIYFQDNRDSVAPSQRLQGCNISSGIAAPGAYDETNGWHLNLSYRLGNHDLRAGVDHYRVESLNGSDTSGGVGWFYFDNPPSGVIESRGNLPVPAGHTGIVERYVFRAIGQAKVEQEAQYLEDNWQISDRWLARIGLRNEQFSNLNADDEVFAKQRHQLAPRLGVSWDVLGDSSLKVYANAGRYHLAIPNNVAVRGASGSLYETQWGTFDGAPNTNGTPPNWTPIENTVYANGADGTPPDPRSISARNLKAYYQDEFILGFDKQLSTSWTLGAKVRYRKLRSIIDDWCDDRPFVKWAADHGVDYADPSPTCYIINPGASNRFAVDLDGDGKLEDIRLSANDIGLPEAKRKYYALDAYLEHRFDNKWYGRLDYTFSRSYGNSEGLLKSDIGQLDPSVTQDWDHKELMIGSNGPEANDRTHQIRAYGYYQITDEWLASANILIQSGRPKNCIGVYPGDIPSEINYGNSYFYCKGQLTARGSQGRLPWQYRLDLGVQYRPAFANHNLAFTMTVVNVFNKQTVLSMNELGETGSGAPNLSYSQPLSYQTPRYFQFGVRYDFQM
ncbi:MULTISPECIES: TonB-dependent receptor [Dyella]|nr:MULTISPECIES: TonB-dependent receptor [Dyella]